MRNQGDYPALDQFRPGETKLVKIPSGSLGWWETHADFDISYKEDDFARALLGGNYIPEQIVGPRFDQELREELIEKLGLEPFTGEEDLREQLRGVAGVSEDDDHGGPEEPNTRAEALRGENRSDLIKVANSYDDVHDFLEEQEVDSVSHAKNTQLAEFLSGKEDSEVDRRLTALKTGGDLE
jgi:hypothetical protein